MRGPPALYESSLVVADAAGEASLIDRFSGGVTCRWTLPDGVDRAGPALAGSTAFFGGLSGALMRVDLAARARACAMKTR